MRPAAAAPAAAPAAVAPPGASAQRQAGSLMPRCNVSKKQHVAFAEVPPAAARTRKSMGPLMPPLPPSMLRPDCPVSPEVQCVK